MRQCALPGCVTSLDGSRATRRYCSDSHRARASELRRGESGGIRSAEAFWRGYGTVVRSRSVSG